MQHWIFISSTKQFRMSEFLARFGCVEYAQKNKVKEGDIVYLYTTAPVQRIEYKMFVEKANVPLEEEIIDDAIYAEYRVHPKRQDFAPFSVRLRLLEQVDTPLLHLSELRKHGLNSSMQGNMKVSGELQEYIESFFTTNNFTQSKHTDMTKLETLYASIEGLKKLGISLNEETLKAADDLEEQLIKDEVLPAISENIEPMLNQIQRDIVLVVEYKPGEPISVSLSRKTNISQIIEAKKLERDPEVEHTIGKSRKKIIFRQPATGLRVYRRDGSFIHETKASDTFVKAIAEAGPLQVRNLGLIVCKIPLVSTTKDKKYSSAQHEVAPGLYVITYTSTEVKKKQLDKISKTLNLGWRVEIVK